MPSCIKLYLLMLCKSRHFKLRLHCEKYLYLESLWSAFFPHFLTFGLNKERYSVSIYLYLVGMRQNVGNMRTGITANTDNFYTVLELSMNSLHELGYIYSPYLSKSSINNRDFWNTGINMSSEWTTGKMADFKLG